jgi:hypothetical protein
MTKGEGSLDDLTDFENLGAGFNTRSLWQVDYDNSSSDHVFTGRLLTVSGSGSAGISGYNVMVCLNEKNEVNCTTGDNGWFVYRRHFASGETTIPYSV